MAAPIPLRDLSSRPTNHPCSQVPIIMANGTPIASQTTGGPSRSHSALSLEDFSSQATVAETDVETGFTRTITKTIDVGLQEDRKVNRKLRAVHLFMITLNATLGIGLYWRVGQILELGGPLAVVLSYGLNGLIVWGVMQGLTEMLCIWPVPGSLSVYVRKFVDEELGIAVGVAHWFTYSMSFSTLLATLTAEFDYWEAFRSRGVHAGFLFAAIPLILIGFNLLRVEKYGFLEVLTGSLKIIFVFVIVILLIYINRGAGTPDNALPVSHYWCPVIKFDSKATSDWPTALLVCISTATFSFVGVEVIAASALEAKWPLQNPHTENIPESHRSSKKPIVGSSVRFTAKWISVFVSAAYLVLGFLATINIQYNDPELPRVTWVDTDQETSNSAPHKSRSVFVTIASRSGIPHLGTVFNVFLIFTCITCAGTNLYIASRALFGMASQLYLSNAWHLKLIALLGKTEERRKVPRRAIIFSTVAFCWIPYLELIGNDNESDASIDTLIEILSTMATVGVLIVWACECLAFIRYYQCTQLIKKNQDELRDQYPEVVDQVKRFDNYYGYSGHLQPATAWLAFTACVVILLVFNGAVLWNGFHFLRFLSSYLAVITFLSVWISLKIIRTGASWKLEKLTAQRAAKILSSLNDLRAVTMVETEPESHPV